LANSAEIDLLNRVDNFASKKLPDRDPLASNNYYYNVQQENNPFKENNNLGLPSQQYKMGNSYTGKDLYIHNNDGFRDMDKYVKSKPPQNPKSKAYEAPDYGYGANQYRTKQIEFADNSKNKSEAYLKPSGNNPFMSSINDDDDIEPPRLSRISKRNVEIERKLQKDNGDEPGIFEKILLGLGCISRDNNKSTK